MAFYAYPRLPQKVPLWLNFSGQPVVKAQKSWFFFFYPVAQTSFFGGFLLASSFLHKSLLRRKKNILFEEEKNKVFHQLRKEYTYLALIFFNLIFIHIQRSLILLAHKIEKGVDPLYFYSLFGILLTLIPYYRLRKKIIKRTL